ncbi:hypothetical protein LTR91_022866 [Friedmanniomyces endolithicus]|uniref:Uncharacterized protein n=1 Tax=Friedmanniomyces endolithicus TaxID=329885 RepID=A0AAN6H578_9PEZI|nr:hypothetical protein LTR94_018994 [Friedmanniomyces endolithicus]KAK0778645.1 hypothetical protein LTR75_015587 [Friedmanniomyces endolithicus]KAK0780542.1 hypothetical protein LTR59_012791 [Friedmanniomyces endolithicus]KAK0782120.1 hypothetical protein LTR38_013496 [Friedmanniomyces endolithicus]KAK0836821.1 hypothetical protein LTR03_013339 [Friedmanniomyces endolithicus]
MGGTERSKPPCDPGSQRTAKQSGYVSPMIECAFKAAWFAAEQGENAAAEEMNRRALKGRGKALGKEHSSTLTSVNNPALMVRFQGKYEAAEEMVRPALEGFEKAQEKEQGKLANIVLTFRYGFASYCQDKLK